MAKPFQLHISDAIQEYVQADADTYGRNFSESLQRFTDIGDRCLREIESIKPIAKRAMSYGADAEEADKLNAYIFMIEIMKNRPDFGTPDKTKCVSFDDGRYAYYKDHAGADGSTFRHALLFRCTVGILITMQYGSLMQEIHTAFGSKGFDGRYVELTNKRAFCNYVEEHIFAAIDADKQKAFQEAKGRFLDALERKDVRLIAQEKRGRGNGTSTPRTKPPQRDLGDT